MRKARLNQQYAELYPTLVSGKWIRASVLAHMVLKASHGGYTPGGDRGARVLNDEHFDFVGGSRRGSRGSSGRTRLNTRASDHDVNYLLGPAV
jgi:hypothetical protein